MKDSGVVKVLMSKSSDRRLAGGSRAASYLHGAQKSGQYEGHFQNKTRPEIVQNQARPDTVHQRGQYNTSGKVSKVSDKLPHKGSENSPYSKVSKPSKTVRRSANGKSWKDDTLVEWDPNHFRLFVGNLGPDANDQLLVEAFEKYPSFVKARVPRDKRTDKNKGYGFVAFSSAEDYLRAFKEMNGKYVGLHPVQLKRAETQVKPRKR